MMTRSIRLMFLGFGIVVLFGCAESRPIAWPSSNFHYQPYHFEPVASVAQAQANIRNLQGDLKWLFVRTAECTGVLVDKEAAHLTYEWTAHQVDSTSTVSDHTTRGGTLRSDVTTRTYDTPTQKKKIVILPFSGIDSVVIQHSLVVFHLDTDTDVPFSCPTEGVAKKLADSVMTLAKANGNKTLPDAGFEVGTGGLSPARRAGLKLDHGYLVTSLEDDGPAEKAGMVPGDVILEVNGRPLDAWEVFRSQLKAGKPLVMRLRNYTHPAGSGELRFMGEKMVALTAQAR